jgi:hypothetical protein
MAPESFSGTLIAEQRSIRGSSRLKPANGNDLINVGRWIAGRAAGMAPDDGPELKN